MTPPPDSATRSELPLADDTSTLPPVPAAPMTAPTPAVPGYEILAELGRGGMGVVYQARHLKLNRIVALKMILAGGHASSAELARFLVEAEAVAALQHPNIVPIFEIGQHDGLPYFTLEFVPGGTLTSRIRRQPMPPLEAAGIVEQLARGMAYAHAKGLIHRDLKPGNVLLAADGTPRITDFGLVKQIDGEGGRLTRSGAIMGTPSYMSPEQAGSQTVGPAADVYSLGAILYECLTGQPPFEGGSTVDVVLQVLTRRPAAAAPVASRPAARPRTDLPALSRKRPGPAPGLGRRPSSVANAVPVRRSGGRRPAAAAPPAGALDAGSPGAGRPPRRAADLRAGAGRQGAGRQDAGQRRRPAEPDLCVGASAAHSHDSRRLDAAVGRVPARPAVHTVGRAGTVRLGGGRCADSDHHAAADRHVRQPDCDRLPADGGRRRAVAGGWFVWFTTGSVILGYLGGIVALASASHLHDVHRHAIFLASLVGLGYMVAYQVRRIQNLSRYYEGRSVH